MSVSVSGARIVIGSPFGIRKRCGKTYEYFFNGQTWRQRAQVVNPSCSAEDLFGWAVALSGKTAVIGAPGKNKGMGAAYVLAVL
jgi:hypothetical protein